jgi:hypothetical protein
MTLTPARGNEKTVLYLVQRIRGVNGLIVSGFDGSVFYKGNLLVPTRRRLLVPTRRRGNPLWTRQRPVCVGNATLARRQGIPTPARGNEKNEKIERITGSHAPAWEPILDAPASSLCG